MLFSYYRTLIKNSRKDNRNRKSSPGKCHNNATLNNVKISKRKSRIRERIIE